MNATVEVYSIHTWAQRKSFLHRWITWSCIPKSQLIQLALHLWPNNQEIYNMSADELTYLMSKHYNIANRPDAQNKKVIHINSHEAWHLIPEFGTDFL